MRRLLAAVVAVFALVAAGCGGGSHTTLTVLAGSELKDLQPLLGQIEHATGVRLQLDYVGTLDGTQQLIAGGDTHDLAWFSHSKYLQLLQQEKGLKVVHAETPIMLSPVVLGVKHSVAVRLGWSGSGKVTWSDIAEAAKAGRLRFAMTNPGSSNSGFTALVGVASAFAGSADALDAGRIDTQAMKDLFAGQKLTAGSSGWLADAYVQSQDRLDGMINYESVLLELNQSGKLHEKLDLIYPAEGIVTANYPLLLLDESRRAAYDKLVEYLLSPDFQEAMMKQTLRRPVSLDVQRRMQVVAGGRRNDAPDLGKRDVPGGRQLHDRRRKILLDDAAEGQRAFARRQRDILHVHVVIADRELAGQLLQLHVG